MGYRAASKEARLLHARIRAAGGEIRPCRRSGHVKVYLDGRFIGTVAGTPSDWRSWKNDIATLRRRGLTAL